MAEHKLEVDWEGDLGPEAGEHLMLMVDAFLKGAKLERTNHSITFWGDPSNAGQASPPPAWKEVEEAVAIVRALAADFDAWWARQPATSHSMLPGILGRVGQRANAWVKRNG